MIKEYIGVIDSGVGGLSVLKELVISMPNENYVYFGDNENAPYGEKSDRRLLELLFNDICMFNDFNLKALVVGCNTLSVSVLEYLRKCFNFEIFGVYPPTLIPLIKGCKTL
jgi:glutamate racemase